MVVQSGHNNLCGVECPAGGYILGAPKGARQKSELEKDSESPFVISLGFR